MPRPDSSLDHADGPTVGLRLEGEAVPAEAFFRAATSFLALLSEMPESSSGIEPVQWTLAGLRMGSAEAVFLPDREEPGVRIIAETLVGLSAFENGVGRRSHFSAGALRRIRELSVAPAGRPVAVFARGRDFPISDTRVTARVTEQVDRLMARATKAIGSVEGSLEAMTIHGKNAFVVYDTITGRRIECVCTEREVVESAMEFLGEVVCVRGEVRYGADGRPTSVAVASFRRLGGEGLVQPEDLRGLFADDPIDLDEWARYVRED